MIGRRLIVAATIGLLVVGLTIGCSNGKPKSDGPISVAVIVKTETNPFFVAIEKGAEKAAKAQGITVTLSAGKEDGDVDSQVTAINEAVARGDKGILITPNGPGVNDAIRTARDAGIFVVALDTKPDPGDVVDITFATDNFEAGRLIGKWSAKKLNGQPAVIALLNLFENRDVSSDVGRNQGFLTGMGIPVADPMKLGDEAKSGNYSAGPYTIACSVPTLGAEDGGRSGMTDCLQRNPDINLVYTINEPAASGAAQVLQAANNKAVMVSVDGGCDPGIKLVQSGAIGATALQYPDEMAAKGLDAIVAYVKDGTTPIPNHGLDLITTGVTLVTNDPQRDVPSIDATEGLTKCWGNPN
ncbi:substrate-binding domain-containing protein [Mycolicibacterium komossense]|uniref:Substrate-binding domain-containing protein n=1 Tax=Mycolicibacterium komossense TaxID=1779 RepID=A0ABT3CGA0_9MYCO|nr:substrate-binding domain-containing protein [Mycolicibacterium komossense]MCV7228446.1 substrate-binding domain-containing protein [Mycolicibacterium komossense]